MTNAANHNPASARDPFIAGVYQNSFILMAIAVAGAAPFGLSLSIGIAAGAMVAIAAFWQLERMIRWAFNRSAKKKWRLRAALITLGKYALLGITLWAVVQSGTVPLEAVAGGMPVVYFASVAQLIRQAIQQRRSGA